MLIHVYFMLKLVLKWSWSVHLLRLNWGSTTICYSTLNGAKMAFIKWRVPSSLILIGWAVFEAVINYSTKLFMSVFCLATTLLQPLPFLRNYIVWRKHNVFINITLNLLRFILWNLTTCTYVYLRVPTMFPSLTLWNLTTCTYVYLQCFLH